MPLRHSFSLWPVKKRGGATEDMNSAAISSCKAAEVEETRRISLLRTNTGASVLTSQILQTCVGIFRITSLRFEVRLCQTVIKHWVWCVSCALNIPHIVPYLLHFAILFLGKSSQIGDPSGLFSCPASILDQETSNFCFSGMQTLKRWCVDLLQSPPEQSDAC